MRPHLAVAALLALSACTAAQVQSAVTTSQLFCQTSQAVVAIVDTTGKPVSVIGQTAQAVAAICAAVNAVPVSPPASPAAAPVVSVDTAAVRARLMRR
jgi:hypothetical protein